MKRRRTRAQEQGGCSVRTAGKQTANSFIEPSWARQEVLNCVEQVKFFKSGGWFTPSRNTRILGKWGYSGHRLANCRLHERKRSHHMKKSEVLTGCKRKRILEKKRRDMRKGQGLWCLSSGANMESRGSTQGEGFKATWGALNKKKEDSMLRNAGG